MKPARLAARVIAVLTVILPTAAAGAAETKPVIAQKSKSAEIEVTIDPALKAYPGLYENLLAEGQRDAAKWRQEADKSLREEPEMFKGDRRHSYDRSYRQRSVVAHYVAILRDDGSYAGGAHPNSYTDTILWDTTAKKRVSIRPFFKETADNGPTMVALEKRVRAAACAAKEKRGAGCDNPVDLSGIKPTLLGLGPVTPAPSTEGGKSSGLTFHFSPYGLGSYAEGAYTLFVPWTDFKDTLSVEGAALFGGTRPEMDVTEFE